MKIFIVIILLLIIIVIFFPITKKEKEDNNIIITTEIEVWYAIDSNGKGFFYLDKPIRDYEMGCFFGKVATYVSDRFKKVLPPLTWEDKPIKITLKV